MTIKQQRRFFFPAWAAACHALHWRMSDGRLQMPDVKNEHQRKVWQAAQEIALKQHRNPTVDDLRHGCYVVALGHDCDTLKMTNKQVDAVTSLFKLLVNDTDIAADLSLANPDIGERKRLVLRIHALKIPDAIIDGVCRKSFAPVYTAPFFEDLPMASLRALVGILTEIKSRKSEERMVLADSHQPQPELLTNTAGFNYPN